MQWQIVLSDNNFPKYSRAHVALSIMVAWRFLKQYHLRAWWSCAFSSGFRPWPFRTEISPDSLNLFTILWTVDGEKPKCFAILHWETLSLNWLTILSQRLTQSGEPLPILAFKKECSFYTQPPLLPGRLLIVEPSCHGSGPAPVCFGSLPFLRHQRGAISGFGLGNGSSMDQLQVLITYQWPWVWALISSLPFDCRSFPTDCLS